jgi:hypothetical protein
LVTSTPQQNTDEEKNAGLGREVAIALSVLFSATFVLLGLELIVPEVAGVTQPILACMLLFIPVLVLRHKPLKVEDLGTTMGPVSLMLKNSLFALLIVFPVFIGGFHIFQTQFLGAEPLWDPAELSRWNQELEHAPSAPCQTSEKGPIAWIDRHGLWVMGPTQSTLSLKGEKLPNTARRVSCSVQGNARAGTPVARQNGTLNAGLHLRGLLIRLDAIDSFHFTLRLNDETLAGDSIRLGRYGEPAESIEAAKTPWWMLVYFIIHLGLIALPEEWFFRGYLQGRLDQIWGKPRRFLGVEFGWGLIASAAAFAALHPILIPGFHRLLVFFPALFFGWLRARTGNIGAAVVVHALSNLLLAVISRMYGVI